MKIKRVGQIFNKIEIIEESNQKSDKQLKIVICKCHCGKIFNHYYSYLSRGRVRSCGCLNSQVGNKNRNYNPLLSNEDRINKRYWWARTRFSKMVFNRDNYTCQVCNYRDGKLNAHHMDGYHWCKNRRDDISNGVTLCKKCHIKFHRIYGHKFNTEFQFKQFQYLYRVK